MNGSTPTILLTEGTSAIGRQLVAQLSAANAAYFVIDPPGSDPLPLLARAGVGAVVINTAEWVDRGQADPAEAAALNVLYSQDVAAVAAATGARRMVVLSSIAVYGPVRSLEIDESAPLDVSQAWTYGRTRAEGELALQAARKSLDLDIVTVRAGLIYGPGAQSWTSDYLELIQKGTPVLWRAGQGVAPLVYVENLAAALLLAATVPAAAAQIFNVADHHIEWRRYAAWLGRLCGRAPRSLSPIAARGLRRLTGAGPEADELEAFYTRRTVFLSRQARDVLGYRAQIDMAGALQRTEAWLREAGYLPAA